MYKNQKQLEEPVDRVAPVVGGPKQSSGLLF